MSEDIWKRDEVESPCINICVIHRREGICTGCLRTLDEIAGWGSKSPESRAAILDALPNRRAALKKRRGGRAARLKDTKA
ncbi:hypothetical protein GGQ68_002949 [Sagittula marina]|uniref:DUF1289 domain-containing protein n=1 Tax=Sagittula marina TaxID=943940 RepID=A0A7W6DRX7_9RHOB|nr:DUF1289 domain-containing protein [Sagittula marina]MBB3986606.1 hypothetical protein [Sagittula marina]